MTLCNHLLPMQCLGRDHWHWIGIARIIPTHTIVVHDPIDMHGGSELRSLWGTPLSSLQSDSSQFLSSCLSGWDQHARQDSSPLIWQCYCIMKPAASALSCSIHPLSAAYQMKMSPAHTPLKGIACSQNLPRVSVIQIMWPEGCFLACTHSVIHEQNILVREHLCHTFVSVRPGCLVAVVSALVPFALLEELLIPGLCVLANLVSMHYSDCVLWMSLVMSAPAWDCLLVIGGRFTITTIRGSTTPTAI